MPGLGRLPLCVGVLNQHRCGAPLPPLRQPRQDVSDCSLRQNATTPRCLSGSVLLLSQQERVRPCELRSREGPRSLPALGMSVKGDCRGSRDYSAKSMETLCYWDLTEPGKYLGLVHSAENTLRKNPTLRDTECPELLLSPAGTEGAQQGAGWA